MNPLVTVIIPNYNLKNYVCEAIDSVLNQTYTNLEILFIDDGSTDGSAEFVENHYNDNRLKIFQKKNGGLSSALNLGIKNANGKYIQFLDSDDFISKDKIKFHVDFLEKNKNYESVYSHMMLYNDKSPNESWEWPRKQFYKSGDILEFLIKNCFILKMMLLTRTNFIRKTGKFSEDFFECEDWDYFLRMCLSGVRFKFLDSEPLVFYRIRNNSISQTRKGLGADELLLFKKLEERIIYKNLQVDDIIKKEKGKWEFIYGKSIYGSKKYIDGYRHMITGLFKDKRNLISKLLTLFLCPFIGVKKSDNLINYLIKIKLESKFFK